ncbi:MAG: two-component regulator propeller domain-containing protein, partial [Maribacter sp.]
MRKFCFYSFKDLQGFVCHKIAILICLIYGLSVSGQNISNDFNFSHLTVNQGLSHSDAMYVIQDHFGFIWIGTNKGLDRYDGIELKNYSLNTEDKNSLSDNRIKTIYNSPENELWIGTENGGLNLYDIQKDRFIRLDVAQFPKKYESLAKALSESYITTISQDQFGQIWAGTKSDGIFVIGRDRMGIFNSLIHIIDRKRKDFLSINALFLDKNKQLWIGTANQGLYKAKNEKLSTENVNTYFSKSSFLAVNIQAIHGDEKGNLWIGADNKVYYINNEHSLNFDMQSVHQLHPEVIFKDITALKLDSRNQLWVGTWYGLYVIKTMNRNGVHDALFPISETRIDVLLPREGSKFSMNSSRVHQIIEDSSQIIWVATSAGGINKLDLLAKPFGHIKPKIPGSNSIASNYINAIYEEENEKLLWLGTRNGFSKYDLDTKKFKNYLNQEFDGTGIDVSAIMNDSSGNLWIGTWNNGFYILRRGARNEYLEKYDIDFSNKSQISNSAISFAEDKYGQIWIATPELGLFVYDKSGKRINSYLINNATLPSKDLRSLYYDIKTSFLWIGT